MQTKKFTLKLLERVNMTDELVLFKFSKPKDFTFLAGQYITLIFEENAKKVARSYSIASSPSKETIDLFVKDVGGSGSKFLLGLKVGDEVSGMGPLGKFALTKESKEREIVFISNGTGLAPIKSMIEDLLEEGFDKRIILIAGFRGEEDISFVEEFKKLSSENPNFKFYYVLSKPKGSYSYVGHVQDYLYKLIPKSFDGSAYICGLKEMVNEVKEKLLNFGFNEEDIYFEKYD